MQYLFIWYLKSGEGKLGHADLNQEWKFSFDENYGTRQLLTRQGNNKFSYYSGNLKGRFD